MKIFLYIASFIAFIQICACARRGKFLKTFEKWNKNYECFSDISKLLKADRFDEMLDTWSNFTKRYTHGNSMDFGNFDKCLDFTHEKVQPQHCLIQYQYKKLSQRKFIPVPPNTTPLNYNWKSTGHRFVGAICIPDTCNGRNVGDLMKEVLNGSDFMQSIDYDQTKYCKQSRVTFEIDTLLVISIVCMLILVAFITVGTYLTYSPSLSFTIKFFQCFSITRNFKSLISEDKSAISCVNGMKAISTIGIFFLHSTLFRVVFPFYDGQELSRTTNSKFFDIVVSLLILMDTFLIISGLLLARSMIKSSKIILWKFYLQRYMRLTSLILIMVCYASLNMFVFQFFPRPYFHLYNLIDDCKTYWWTMALHIQNFVNPKQMCLPQSWFASTLFQMIILAPLVHLLLRNQKNFVKYFCYGIVLLIGLTLRLLVFIPRKTYFDTETAIVVEMNNDIVAYTYFTSYTRVISFFSGVLLAHIIEQDSKVFICSNEKVHNFIISCGLYLSVAALVIYPFIFPLAKNLIIVYGIVWIIATNFVIYGCYKGHGSLINWFLSLKLWTPLSKMGLTIYLVAPFFQGLWVITKSTPWVTLSPQQVLFGFLCDVSLAAAPIVLIYVAVECSFTNLGKLLTSTQKPKSNVAK